MSRRILYQSIVNVGGLWYGFGWESQLLETGFLAIWMCPCCTLRRFPRHAPTPLIVRMPTHSPNLCEELLSGFAAAQVIWAYRWLIFRIMLGAGLIKARGHSLHITETSPPS